MDFDQMSKETEFGQDMEGVEISTDVKIKLNKSMIIDVGHSFKKISSILSNSSDQTRVNYIFFKYRARDPLK